MNGHEAAALLRTIAERLERNPPEEFSGCYVIVPPGDTEPLDGLSLKSKPDLPSFWSGVSGAIEIAIAELQESVRARRPGGR